MKHNVTVTIFLMVIFVLTQIFGLYLINKDIDKIETDQNNNIQIVHSAETGELRPQTTGAGSLIYILIAIAVGTILLLLIIKFNKVNYWKLWFFLAVTIAIAIALTVIIKSFYISLAIAAVFAILKIYKPNIIIHNFTEILMYSGIAVLLVPIFKGEILLVIILLLIISVYDMIAVWKSKHMIKMAKFQSKSKVFAGLMIPYTPKFTNSKAQVIMPVSKNKILRKRQEQKTAILGGGDLVFPLLFIGVVFEYLLKKGLTANIASLESYILVITTALALALLLIFAKKDKFYPAMPFITAGCLVGLGIVYLIQYI